MPLLSLLEHCLATLARSLPLPATTAAPSPANLPDEALAIRLVQAYLAVDQARRRMLPSTTYDARRHLAALRQLSALWQPSALVVAVPCLPSQPGVALCAELQAFSTSLAHLELRSAAASSLFGLHNLHNLSCLSLRGAPNLSTASIQLALQQLPQLTSLDLCGLGAAASDALAPTLCSLTSLVVLQLNRTSCGDTTVEYLTYGNRLHAWSTQQPAAGSGAPLGSDISSMQQQWPRCKIRCWHLAHSRVTPRVVELLGSCPDILLLDLRGSGVRAAQLSPLRVRHALNAVQGAVLARTAAMTLAAVTLEEFVCAGAAQHGGEVAALKVAVAAAEAAGRRPQQLRVQPHGTASCEVAAGFVVENEGVSALLAAAAAVDGGQ